MTRALQHRPWVPAHSEALVAEVADRTAACGPAALLADLDHLVAENERIHHVETLNLNPATNLMNPRAEAMLSARLGSRASLGYPGEKYETGLEAIERIEVVAAELAAEVFGASYAEIRVPSGAIANLYAFLVTCEPGDTIIAPPPSIGGHVTHHAGGSAGMYRLRTLPAPVDAARFTVDVDRLRDLAHEARPRLITLGASMNLYPHPVAAVREIADEVGAKVLFDAAHLCGLIAGGAWPNPLEQGAHLMTMSTYKSLGGPPGGLIVTNEADLAQRLDAVAYPGLTANFDAAKSAALAVTLVDWKAVGPAYAAAMLETASGLAEGLERRGVELFRGADGPTRSHMLGVLAAPYGGGQAASRRLRRAHLLACGIGLPVEEVAGDTNGLRLGTPELARLGMTGVDMEPLAGFLARGLDPAVAPETVGAEVTEWRAQFGAVHFTAQD
ncbi:beta-eliminating lyase-related protein [Nocardioides sp. cx-169]|uniref:serine hydroxymethyltransferase n=1 Tax=Nocardioides sp. cx-169 TaxID=2899080 RepID=UPI001E4725B3|nr:aminotransferase class I/II-fold pyridoxal phosphate-dependent enzyme [Nocardioides sp. cx-169]MCD4534388.1 beta-eliminating lyase-related protein [Nocardioides sp. cx-169]